ncbi:MAG: aspartate--ammonia ligase [Clostridiaceae bacterium]|jgi:aspartate--ammonia ligase|nr:aspartate--ammonia ligase [Clostridiaceae bacterium]
MYSVKNYQDSLSIRETEVAIKVIKDFFEAQLAKKLNLTRVSAPLFVERATGLNDNLNGIERPVSFDALSLKDSELEIVQSLAKWKRTALKRYRFLPGEGLYTDMNAIRRDEELDNLHSIYVDQWDWEKIIRKEERTPETLKTVVKTIYSVFLDTGKLMSELYPQFKPALPDEIFFITAQELEDMYPDKTPKERENLITREKGAVFLMQIGSLLESGIRHDGRAPDYDDWSLNGDILFWYPVLQCAFELSSMGIRVDEEALLKQLEISGCTDRKELPYHSALLKGELPYTIGGGIGQSRICMYFLQKAHIGEVQSSVWPDSMINLCEKRNIKLL